MNRRPRLRSSRRGIALIVVLGVLVVLSLLATTFATVTSLDRNVARNYLDGIRAELVARSGVDSAVADIVAGVERGLTSDPSMTYWGTNVTETGDPAWKIPLEKALNPSFAWEDEASQNPVDTNVKPMSFLLDGAPAGLSGFMEGGTYAPHGDAYRVRVTDANGMIHLNDGLEAGNAGRVSLNLKRILNVLGSVVGAPNAGDAILAARPAGGYRSKRELETVLGSSGYAKIRPFVTVRAWVDPAVVNPVPLSAETLSAYPVPYNQPIGLYRYGRSRASSGQLITGAPLRWAPEFASPTGTDHSIFAMDELNAQWIERVGRAPVNVNAAPREVLISLIAGLRGWFVVERRKTNPGQGMYTYLFHPPYDNAPGGLVGDEYGFLYSTAEFLAPGVTGTSGVAAGDVADEILACRARLASPHCPGLDYSGVWYGGPFLTWKQFNAFCDGLVTGGLLKDTRPIFYDYKLRAPGSRQITDATGPNELLPSAAQPAFAARALADVLKANFNPNCALNELNPEANLHLIVDKTDLICNSTEFSLRPMGLFEIESEGLVLRTAGNADFLAAKKAEIVARKKVACIVEAFRVHRETTQADFMQGQAELRTGAMPVTSNNRTMEIGPEPDNGPAAKECRWSGWIQLSTIGGPWTSSGQTHAPGTVEPTPVGASEKLDVAHAHFQLDHRLHHHASGDHAPLFSGTSQCKNHPDRTESDPGPYGPTVGAAGRHRLARDWHASALPASPGYVAPSDLRVDGAYIERDSALMYAASLGVLDSVGTVSYWVKPSFRPEMTGKPRTWFSIDTTKPIGSKTWQLINGQWFFACQDVEPGLASPNEAILPVYPDGPWRPASLVGGYSTIGGVGGGVGTETRSLNHRAHADSVNEDLLRHHGWIHVTYHWNFLTQKTLLWINGTLQPGMSDISVHPGALSINEFINGMNPLRLGEPSKTMTAPGYAGKVYGRNWSADATIDEFYVWKGNQLAKGQDLFALGRFHRPRKSFEAVFTSKPMPLAAADRVLAPPSSSAAPPSPSGSPAPPAAGPGTMTLAVPTARVLGASWTWYPESIDADGKPWIRDWAFDTDMTPEVELRFVVNGAEHPSILTNDAGCAPAGLAVAASDTLSYRIRFRIPDATSNSSFLSTPILDDVTIFYTTGVRYLSYELQGVTP